MEIILSWLEPHHWAVFQEQDSGLGLTVEEDPYPGSQLADHVTESQGRRQKPSDQNLGNPRSRPDKQERWWCSNPKLETKVPWILLNVSYRLGLRYDQRWALGDHGVSPGGLGGSGTCLLPLLEDKLLRVFGSLPLCSCSTSVDYIPCSCKDGEGP